MQYWQRQIKRANLYKIGAIEVKRAFTLLELVITMAILSIVAYIASDLIAKTYKGYNSVNNLLRANLKVESALNLIANRLENAIDGTIVKRNITDGSISPIDNVPAKNSKQFSILEWVGSDIDGFEAHAHLSGTKLNTINQPAWSGFCDIKQSTKKTIITPGSNLNFAQSIIYNLSNKKVTFQNGLVALFFPGDYNYRNIGYNGTAPNGLALISGFNQIKSSFSLLGSITRITEHYKLAWSAYAVVPTNCNAKGVCDLELRYNFRPWRGVDYNSATVPSSIMAKNVTVFKTYATQNRVHIKLCIQEHLGVKSTTSICKEKVVFK